MTAWRSGYGKTFNIRGRNKYGSTKVTENGMTFDSKKEADRYRELKLMEEAGTISGLKTQVKYVLIPSQRDKDTKGPRGGIKKGKVLERECAYYADFVYRDNATGEIVVEDTKSPATRTKEYIIKRKLMLRVHGIRIIEL